jgi:ribose 5-phosphate isomerase B
MKEKILIGADHAGYELKEQLKTFLIEKGYEVEDFGAGKLDPNDDYPVILTPLAYELARNPMHKAIVLGGSGQGEAIICNRFPGIRATVYYGGNTEILKLGREHNDANVLSLGARFLSVEEAKEAVSIWLETKFSEDERHIRRITLLDEIE